MKRLKKLARNRLFRVLAPALLACLTACAKKSDPAAANVGGGASTQRNVITMKGDAQ